QACAPAVRWPVCFLPALGRTAEAARLAPSRRLRGCTRAGECPVADSSSKDGTAARRNASRDTGPTASFLWVSSISVGRLAASPGLAGGAVSLYPRSPAARAATLSLGRAASVPARSLLSRDVPTTTATVRQVGWCKLATRLAAPCPIAEGKQGRDQDP